MNSTIKELLDRKSVRVYEDKQITIEIKNQILLAAINAPTAGNMQLYSIIDVNDQEKLDKLSILCDNQPFIKNSKMCLIFLADATRWYKFYNELEANKMQPTIADYFLAFSDAMCAAQNAVVAAHSFGIGSCYIGDICENYEQTQELLNLPKHVLPVAMLVFGYPTPEQQNRAKPARFKISDVVFENTYQDQNYDELLEALTNKIQQGNELSLEDAKQKALKFISILCKRKQKALFFDEMNRSLKLMLKDYFK